jgi:hypothetical protein
MDFKPFRQKAPLRKATYIIHTNFKPLSFNLSNHFLYL